MGLSPHARGNRRRCQPRNILFGSIPARAGKPGWYVTCGPPYGVYPRTRGETKGDARGSGTDRGLSPHARGNHYSARNGDAGMGSIPARAGKPGWYVTCGPPYGVYPRTRGETTRRYVVANRTWGLSPHARGNPSQAHIRAFFEGSIPARAGKPVNGSARLEQYRVYPRTRGETGSRRHRPA